MLEIVEWTNKNNGFLMAVLTCIYVVATFVIAWFGWQANKLSAKNISQSIEIERMRSRPYLVFDIEHRKSLVFAVLKNIGQTGAFDVSLSLVPTLEGNLGNQMRQTVLTNTKISFIAPGRQLSDLVASGHQFYQHYSTPQFKANILYRDSSGALFSEAFLIDLTHLKESAGIREPDIPTEMEKLVKEVRDMSRILDRLQKTAETSIEKKSYQDTTSQILTENE